MADAGGPSLGRLFGLFALAAEFTVVDPLRRKLGLTDRSFPPLEQTGRSTVTHVIMDHDLPLSRSPLTALRAGRASASAVGIAAQRYRWPQLSDAAGDERDAAALAQELVLRGEDIIRGNGGAHPESLGLPLALQPWEPRYALRRYVGSSGRWQSWLEVPFVEGTSLPTVGIGFLYEERPPGPWQAVRAQPGRHVTHPMVTAALAGLRTSPTAVVAGTVAEAVSAVSETSPSPARPSWDSAWVAPLPAAQALGFAAWTRVLLGDGGSAEGRVAAWRLAAAATGVGWPADPDALGTALRRLDWYVWTDRLSGRSNPLRWGLAVADPANGWAAAAARIEGWDDRANAPALSGEDHDPGEADLGLGEADLDLDAAGADADIGDLEMFDDLEMSDDLADAYVEFDLDSILTVEAFCIELVDDGMESSVAFIDDENDGEILAWLWLWHNADLEVRGYPPDLPPPGLPGAAFDIEDRCAIRVFDHEDHIYIGAPLDEHVSRFRVPIARYLWAWRRFVEQSRLAGSTFDSVEQAIGAPPEHVTRLLLSGQHIVDLPAQLRRCVNLTTLDVTRTSLTEIPAWIGDLANLRELQGASIGLRGVPESLGALRRVEVLDLSHNSLLTLPATMADLLALRHLRVCANALPEIPPWIGRLRQLEHLDLRDNRLRGLPAELCHLTRLRHLDLAGNKLRAMPTQLDRLVSLETLDVSGSKLSNAELDRIRMGLPRTRITCRRR